MAQSRKRNFQQMQWYLTYALIAAVGMFALYLVFAGLGIIWLKAVTAVLAILISAACLAWLFLSKELLRPRSLWMTTAACAIIVCLLVSLVLRFPSPNKYKQTAPADTKAAAVKILEENL